MSDYTNAKIYKLTCNITDLCYVGSTCQTLSKRLKGHESQYKQFLEGKFNWLTSFEIIQLGDYSIEQLEKVDCENEQELREREGYHTKQLRDFAVNKKIEGQTKEELYEKRLQACKDYHYNNRDRHNAIMREKGSEKVLCECGIVYTKANKFNHKRTTHHREFKEGIAV